MIYSESPCLSVLNIFILCFYLNIIENPSSTLHEYNWDIPFATTPPFDALEAATATATATGTSDEQQYSTEKKLLYDLKQLISDLLHPDIACRSGIWNIHKVYMICHMSWSFSACACTCACACTVIHLSYRANSDLFLFFKN